MSKRPSLAESMRAVAAAPDSATDPEPTPRPPVVKPKPTVPLPQPSLPDERPKGFYAATRLGMKKATATLSPAAHRQLKGLALEQEGQTVERLLTEAINDLFEKYGKQPIA